MALWTQFVDVLREAMFAYAHATNGNLALGIMAVTFLARLALFPLALRLARAAAVHEEAVRRVQPELDAVRVRFKNDPPRMAEESRRILSRAGVSAVPVAGCVGALFQAPVFLALFSAVRQCAAVGGRFMWIRDISRPDVALTLVVAVVTIASTAAGPPTSAGAQNRMLMILLPAAFTVIALWQMAAGIGLYWGVSSAVGMAQGLVLRRARERRPN